MQSPEVNSPRVEVSGSAIHFTPTSGTSSGKGKRISVITPHTVLSSQETTIQPVPRRSLPRAAKIPTSYSSLIESDYIKQNDEGEYSLTSTKSSTKTPLAARESPKKKSRLSRPDLKQVLVNKVVTPVPQANVHFSGFGDIICGRGCGHKTASRLSNLKYRLLLNCHRDLYDGAIGKNDKRLVCEMILEHIFEHGGRFVQMPPKGEVWETFSYEMCISKISQSFRDLRALDYGKSTLDTVTLRPGTPTAKDIDAWQRLRESITERISLGSQVQRKPSPTKKKKSKQKRALPCASKPSKSFTVSSSGRPLRPSQLRRVSIDHRDPFTPTDEDDSTMTETSSKSLNISAVNYENKDVRSYQKTSVTPSIVARERLRRVSLELGQGQIETEDRKVSGSSFVVETPQRSLLKSYASNLMVNEYFTHSNSSSKANPHGSNRSPYDEFLSPTLARMLCISPIKMDLFSDERVCQVPPKRANTSPMLSLAARLEDFEEKQTMTGDPHSKEQYQIVKIDFLTASTEPGLAHHDASLIHNDSVFWDLHGGSVQMDQEGHRQSDAFNSTAFSEEEEHIYYQGLQDMLFLSSQSIGEVTDVSSADTLVTNEEMDVSMDWFCTAFTQEQSRSIHEHHTDATPMTDRTQP